MGKWRGRGPDRKVPQGLKPTLIFEAYRNAEALRHPKAPTGSKDQGRVGRNGILMAIFLTGSTGYIGAHVAANLLRDQRAGRMAGRGEEGQDRDLPAVLAQRYAPAPLVGEREVGCAYTAGQ